MLEIHKYVTMRQHISDQLMDQRINQSVKNYVVGRKQWKYNIQKFTWWSKTSFKMGDYSDMGYIFENINYHLILNLKENIVRTH